jgi:hypothetical protein
MKSHLVVPGVTATLPGSAALLMQGNRSSFGQDQISTFHELL